jgi:hypothetical protein
LEGSISGSNLSNANLDSNTLDSLGTLVKDVVTNIEDGANVAKREVGLFFHCKHFMDKKFFDGKCVPEWDKLGNLFKEWDDDKYPHPWRGAIICFALGLALMVLTDLFALLTVCCRSCICCSVFTICGSIQSFAGILFTLGLIAYPAGWGSMKVKNEYCGGASEPFILIFRFDVSFFWLAVAGTVCTVLASSLAIWAYQSTRSQKCDDAKDAGEHCICLV